VARNSFTDSAWDDLTYLTKKEKQMTKLLVCL
jgi:hypothetical protein